MNKSGIFLPKNNLGFISNLKSRILPKPNFIIKIDIEFKYLSFKYNLCIKEIKI